MGSALPAQPIRRTIRILRRSLPKRKAARTRITAEPLTERELAFRAQEEELANFMGLIQQYVKDNQLSKKISSSRTSRKGLPLR